MVATPIGNLGDLTQRALEVLRAVHTVFAEDTRDSGRLLARLGIQARLAALHAHNERRAAAAIVRLLAAGCDVALVADAGTPAVSDPGAHAVAAVRAAGFEVVPVPGANAAIAALSVAGMPGPFAFVGFLPAQAGARRRELERWRSFPHTLVFYEAPHRVAKAVADLAAALGAGRTIVLARELTKLFETVHETTLGEAPAWLAADANRQRGEFVLVVAGAGEPTGAALEREGERVLRLLIEALPVRTAARLAAEITGASRKALYAKALELAGRARPGRAIG